MTRAGRVGGLLVLALLLAVVVLGAVAVPARAEESVGLISRMPVTAAVD